MAPPYRLAVALAVLALPLPSFGNDAKRAMTPKDECDVLVNAVVPFARQMLSEHHSFFPFGATMSPAGTVSRTETPKGDLPVGELIGLIEQGFVDGGKRGLYKATALVSDVTTVPPRRVEKQRAVEVRLDHRDKLLRESGVPLFVLPLGRARLRAPLCGARGQNDLRTLRGIEVTAGSLTQPTNSELFRRTAEQVPRLERHY